MPITIHRAFALCASIVPFAAQTALAEVVIGHKNDPAIELERNLTDLLGSEAPSVTADPDHRLSDVLTGAEPPDAVVLTYSSDFVADLPDGSGDAQWSCLTEALYFEARGEEVRGIFAVAEVILNRVDSSRFPSTVCGVVKQGTGEKWRCQFTYTCDGLAETVREKRAWRRMGKIARRMLDDGPRPLTRGALYYHTRAVQPYWSHVFDRTTTIGAHHFYAQG